MKRSGDTIPLTIALRSSDTGLFPRARVLTSGGIEAVGSPINLSDIGGSFSGTYQGLWTIPAAGRYTAIITVYTDSGHTTVSSLFLLETIDIETDDSSIPGDAMTLTGGERSAMAAAVRDVGLSSSGDGSLGQALQILLGLAAKANMRIDNMSYTNSFLTSCRIRAFEDNASAMVSTDGGVGEGEIFTLTLTGTPDIIQTQLPATILSLLS